MPPSPMRTCNPALLAMWRLFAALFVALQCAHSRPAMAEVYACTVQDAARLVSARMGGSMSTVGSGYKVTGAVKGKAIAVQFAPYGSCSAEVKVSVDTSQGWNAEARAEEIRAELTGSVAAIMRQCSNHSCEEAEAEARRQAEAAKAEAAERAKEEAAATRAAADEALRLRCDFLEGLAGLWNDIDSAGRVVGQWSFGSCRSKGERVATTVSIKDWESEVSLAAELVSSDGSQGDLRLVPDLGLMGIFGSAEIVLSGIRLRGSRLCYESSNTSVAVLLAGSNSQSSAGSCLAKASRLLSISDIYVDPATKRETLRKRCVSVCDDERTSCQKDYGNHPGCSSNFYTCSDRCQ